MTPPMTPGPSTSEAPLLLRDAERETGADPDPPPRLDRRDEGGGKGCIADVNDDCCCSVAACDAACDAACCNRRWMSLSAAPAPAAAATAANVAGVSPSASSALGSAPAPRSSSQARRALLVAAWCSAAAAKAERGRGRPAGMRSRAVEVEEGASGRRREAAVTARWSGVVPSVVTARACFSSAGDCSDVLFGFGVGGGEPEV